MAKKTQFSSEYNLDLSPVYLTGSRDVFYGVEYLPEIIYENACRYKNLRTIKDEYTNNIHHESWKKHTVRSSNEDEYYTVSNVDEGRLDIIAYNFYGTPRFWWVIALANEIIDPFDIPVGTTLRIPPKHSLYLSGGVLSG